GELHLRSGLPVTARSLLVTLEGARPLAAIAHPFRPRSAITSVVGTLRAFVFLGSFGRRPFAALQLMQQRRSNVRRTEPLFEQTFDQMVLPFEIAALQRAADFVQE